MNEQTQNNRQKLFLEKIYSTTRNLIFNSNSRNTNWIVDPFTQKKISQAHGKFNPKSISNLGAFCIFLLTPMSKCVKHLWNIYKYIIFLKTLFSWPLSTTNTWKFFKNLSTLVKFQNRPSAPWGRRQGKISWKTISCWKAFLWSQNENRAFLWTFPFHLCLLTGIFNLFNLLSCKSPHGWRAAANLFGNGFF